MANSSASRLTKHFLFSFSETTNIHKLEILLADQRLSDFLLDFSSKPRKIDALLLYGCAGFVLMMLLF